MKRSVWCMTLVMLQCSILSAQNGILYPHILEYRPAPGQHINLSGTGTPAAAEGLSGGFRGPVSMGAYGGRITFGLSKPVENHPDNPFGIDFVLYGNASPTHSEPGIVEVMEDMNRNGLPDDTWYEIAGSATYLQKVVDNYSIFYSNPNPQNPSDIPWTDNQGRSGLIPRNNFHTQPYYPLNESFPEIPENGMSCSGSLIQGNLFADKGFYYSYPYDFGYADNTPVLSTLPTGKPDNPYTRDSIEGDGGDAIDISWAVDQAGNFAELNRIDFIRVYTGVNQLAGWLGEISTDITGIADVETDPGWDGVVKMIVPLNLPECMTPAATLTIKSVVLNFGRPENGETIVWESGDTRLAEIKGSELIALNTGIVKILGHLSGTPEVVFEKDLRITIPERIILESEEKTLEAGDTFTLGYRITDKTGLPINGIRPEISMDNPGLAGITGVDDNHIRILACKEGETILRLRIPGHESYYALFFLRIHDNPEALRITFSMSTEDYPIVPLQEFTAVKNDILRYTERYGKDFKPDRDYINLADVIVSVLSSEGFKSGGKSILFRQDQHGGNGLYLWQVGIDWEYIYGWGGSEQGDQYAKTWYAIVNDRVFASGFDTIKIHDYDRITLHHVADKRNDWSIIRLIPSSYNVPVGESILFHAEKLDVYPGPDGSYMVSGPYPLTNARIQAGTGVLDEALSDQQSNFRGELRLSFSSPGNHTISLANSEETRISVVTPLLVNPVPVFAIYPVPFAESLTIEGFAAGTYMIEIHNCAGILVKTAIVNGGERNITFPLSDLPPGPYILSIMTSNTRGRYKIIKRN